MGKLLRVNKWDFFLPLNLLYSASTTSPRFYIVGTPLIKGGEVHDLPKIELLGGRVSKILLERGDNPEKGAEGSCHFFLL